MKFRVWYGGTWKCPCSPAWVSEPPPFGFYGNFIGYFCSGAQLCLTLYNPMDCSMPGFPSFTLFLSLLKLMSVKSMMPSDNLILCHPFLLLPSILPSIRVFSKETVVCIRWSKYWSFIFSISLSNEYSGLISFKINWFDLLAVQGTLKSFL